MFPAGYFMEFLDVVLVESAYHCLKSLNFDFQGLVFSKTNKSLQSSMLSCQGE